MIIYKRTVLSIEVMKNVGFNCMPIRVFWILDCRYLQPLPLNNYIGTTGDTMSEKSKIFRWTKTRWIPFVERPGLNLLTWTAAKYTGHLTRKHRMDEWKLVINVTRDCGRALQTTISHTWSPDAHSKAPQNDACILTANKYCAVHSQNLSFYILYFISLRTFVTFVIAYTQYCSLQDRYFSGKK